NFTTEITDLIDRNSLRKLTGAAKFVPSVVKAIICICINKTLHQNPHLTAKGCVETKQEIMNETMQSIKAIFPNEVESYPAIERVIDRHLRCKSAWIINGVNHTKKDGELQPPSDAALAAFVRTKSGPMMIIHDAVKSGSISRDVAGILKDLRDKSSPKKFADVLKPLVPLDSSKDNENASNSRGASADTESTHEDISVDFSRLSIKNQAEDQAPQNQSEGINQRPKERGSSDECKRMEPNAFEKSLVGLKFEDDGIEWCVLAIGFEESLDELVAYYYKTASALSREELLCDIYHKDVEHSSIEEVVQWINANPK
ncbi:MAG: hypothetical protein ACPG4S_08355, partial [Schleiferiaceae bacterium]